MHKATTVTLRNCTYSGHFPQVLCISVKPGIYTWSLWCCLFPARASKCAPALLSAFTPGSSAVCFRIYSKTLQTMSVPGMYFRLRHLLSVTCCDLPSHCKTNTTGHTDFIDNFSQCDVLSAVADLRIKSKQIKLWPMRVLWANKIPLNFCTCRLCVGGL